MLIVARLIINMIGGDQYEHLKDQNYNHFENE